MLRQLSACANHCCLNGLDLLSVTEYSLLTLILSGTETPDMSLSPAVCPIGETGCPLLQEVTELRQQVITDPLTGLHNVRYFRNSLEHELERTRRTGMATALMMVDLDHFKNINDTHGHENGNRVLIFVAELLNSATRKLDLCCRYGGEEFAVILPSTELMLARQVAERFRQALEESDIPLTEGTLKVTASIGIAVAPDSDEIEPGALIEMADGALYEAKRGGRNQVRAQRPPEKDHHVTVDERDALRNLFSGD